MFSPVLAALSSAALCSAALSSSAAARCLYLSPIGEYDAVWRRRIN